MTGFLEVGKPSLKWYSVVDQDPPKPKNADPDPAVFCFRPKLFILLMTNFNDLLAQSNPVKIDDMIC